MSEVIWTAHTVRKNPLEVYDLEQDDFVICKTDAERVRILKKNDRIRSQAPRTEYTPEQIELFKKIATGLA